MPSVALAQAIEPGWWEVENRIAAADMPGAPAGAAERLRGRTQTARRCLTLAEAARGPQDMMRADPGCRIVRYSRKAGRIDGQMICKDAAGTLTATTTGRFTPTSFTSTARLVRKGGGSMAMTIVTTGKRTGSCAK